MNRSERLLTEIPQILRRAPPLWTLLLPSAVFLWFSTLFLLSELNVDFPVLIRGVGLANYSSNMNIISPEIDYAIWLLSLFTILLTFFKQTPFHWITRDRWAKLAASLLITSAVTYFLDYVSAARVISIIATTAIIYISILRAAEIGVLSKRRAVGILLVIWLGFSLAIELLTSIRWSLNGFDGSQPFSDPSWSIAFLELQMTNILQPILPRLFVLFSVAWLLRLLSFPYEKTVQSLVTKILNLKSLTALDNPTRRSNEKLFAKIILGASIILAIFIGVYPYLPALNPSSLLVGVDSKFYYNQMENSLNLDVTTFLTNIIQQDRSLFLALQQTIATLIGSTDLAIRLIPLVLGGLLTISVYYLVSTSTKDRFLASIATILTATSYQVMAGINAGFYANWLAVIELNLFLALFLRAIENKTLKFSIPSIILPVLVLFTHSATWIVLIAMLMIYALIIYTRKTFERHEARIIAWIIAVNIGAEVFKNTFLQSHSTLLLAQNLTPSLSFDYFFQVFLNLDITFTYFLGGAFANPIILILASIGLFLTAKSHQRFNMILLGYTIVCVAGTFFASPAAPTYLQSRFIYLLPFPILSAIGLKYIFEISARFSSETGGIGRSIPFLLILAVISYLLSYTLRVVGFIYTV